MPSLANLAPAASPDVSWTGSVSNSSFNDTRSLPLPPIRDQLHLINDFFRHLHPLPIYGFLNEIPVTQRCLQGSLDETLLLSLCAVSAMHLKYTKYHPVSTASWIQRAEDMIWARIEQPSIFRTQALILIIHFRIEGGSFQKAYMLFAIAARAASALRLQYERIDLGHLAQEVRRRLMWSLMMFDGQFSTGLPESEMCSHESIYLKLPCKEEEFHADYGRDEAGGDMASSMDGVQEEGLLSIYIRETMMRRDIMRLMRQVRLSGRPMPQLVDLVDEFAKSLQQLPIPPYSVQDLERYSRSRWLLRYLAVHLSWHQAHCDVYRLFLSGYREAAPAVVISAYNPSYIEMAARLCLHHAQSMITILTDWDTLGCYPVAAHYDIAICGYHACRLILFLSRSSHLPAESSITPEVASTQANAILAICRRLYKDSALVDHLIKDLEAVIQAHANGEPEHRRDSSDPDDDNTSHQPRFAVTVQRHKILGVHSVLRRARFIDDSADSAEAPDIQGPSKYAVPADAAPASFKPAEPSSNMTTQSGTLGTASDMDTSAFESLTQAPLENTVETPQFAVASEPFNLGSWDTTPNLDRIANEGMRFDHCYVTNSICTPSRAAVLCGTHNHVNGVMTLDSKINKRIPNVAKQLRSNANYQTAMIGKWHLGEGEEHEPTGFDYWSVLPGQGEYWDPEFIEATGKTARIPGYATDIITDKSIEWMDKRDKSRPFFLMCHHKAPHRSWEYDSKHKDLYKDPVRLPDTFTDDYKNRANAAKVAKMRVAEDLTYNDLGIVQPEGPRSVIGEKMIDIWWWQDRKIPAPEDVTGLKLFCKETGEAFTFQTQKELAEWKFQRYMQRYLRTIQSIDDNVGRMLDWLDKEGLAEDTIIMYTSDQGFFLGEHGWFDKRFMYEESFQMPFMIRYPREIAPKSVCKDIICNVDFAPTFLDFANARIPTYMQGVSFRPVAQGKTPADWQQVAYHRYWMHRDIIHEAYAHYGVRDQRYKLIYWYNEDFGLEGTRPGGEEKEWELFDCQEDPLELFNCYNDAKYADVVKKMTKMLEDKMEEIGDETVHPRLLN
ncbi:alkaline-phosphatase-like protein [Ilyonectria destructans]|nr:alkaline-phosphatase-like protein [Ilyonectria destructans]